MYLVGPLLLVFSVFILLYAIGVLYFYPKRIAECRKQKQKYINGLLLYNEKNVDEQYMKDIEKLKEDNKDRPPNLFTFLCVLHEKEEAERRMEERKSPRKFF